MDVAELVGQIDNGSLKEELQTCTHFPVDSWMENARHRVFNFGMEVLDAHTLSQKQTQSSTSRSSGVLQGSMLHLTLCLRFLKMGIVGNTMCSKTTL